MTQFIPQMVIVDQYGVPVMSGGSINDSSFTYTLTPGALAQTITYVGTSNKVSSVLAGPDLSGYFYKQSITYNASNNISSISAWVKQ